MLLGVPATPGQVAEEYLGQTDSEGHTAPTPPPPTPSTAGCSQSDLSMGAGICHPCPVPPTPCPAPHRARTPQCWWGAAGGSQQSPPLRCPRIWELSWGLAFCSHHQRASIRGCRLINLEARLIPEPRRVLFPRNLAPGDSQGLCDTRAVTRPRCCAPGLLSAGSGTPGDPSSPREGCAGTPAGEGGAARGN